MAEARRDNFGSCIGAYINAVYYRQSLARRASRFPWFRDDEPFVALDATVTYASESRLPAMRAALDAPRAFVVFALREPVARAFSDFRFCYRPYFFSQDIGFDAATLGALDAYDACYGAARAFYDDALLTQPLERGRVCAVTTCQMGPRGFCLLVGSATCSQFSCGLNVRDGVATAAESLTMVEHGRRVLELQCGPDERERAQQAQQSEVVGDLARTSDAQRPHDEGESDPELVRV